MPDDRLLSDDGDVYEKNIVGDWVKPRPNMTGYERDVGLLGPNIEPDWGGSPKKARDWAGRPVRATDGRQLYVPKLPLGRPGESLEGIILWTIWAAIVILIALAIVGAWIVWRFASSAYYDIRDKQLSMATVGWSIPVMLMLAGGIWYAAMPRDSGASRGVAPYRNAAQPAGAATFTGAKSPAQKPPAQAAERELRALMPGHRCLPWGMEDDRAVFAAGAQAAVNCRGVAPGVEDFALFTFVSRQSLGAHFSNRVASERPKVTERAGSCADGNRGWMVWEHGRVACWTDPRDQITKTELRWTHTRTDTYGVMSATYRDTGQLYRTWLRERP